MSAWLKDPGGFPFSHSWAIARNRARLLEHDFGNPDGVGTGGAAPRKIAAPATVPGEQQVAERRALHCRKSGRFGLNGLHSMTRSHSATTAKPSGSTSQASNSGFR